MDILDTHVVFGDIVLSSLSDKISAQHDFDELMSLVEGNIEKGNLLFSLDFREVTFINSGGLGTLINILKYIQDCGGKLSIFGASEDVDGLFDMVSLKERINIVKTKELSIGFLKA